ncbi:hypothetical protein COHA_001390 [Chlorella ohadii]|uniref:RING-type domain-containing protein n=1 Tax=Chlorella ohadii TaxID=2649997 RepID=A0AAD5E211_9CHLO|nr:hypothetical protein COHA_001390 [Chlorella ohadii]
MQPFFSVTLFTGQQLIIEAIQRWLQRPCADETAVQQRRLGLKGLISLLLRTAATGVLATLLDAAIEFRRRQLLAAAAADEGGAAGGDGVPSRFPGLGMLSRAGVAAWKARLLVAIDELERRAEACGIESRRRFSPGKDANDELAAAEGGKPATAGGLRSHSPSAACLAPGEEEEEESQSQRLGRTVEQLRELVQQGDPESERRLDEEDVAGPASEPGSPTGSASGGLCMICMDRAVRVQVAECKHELCFGCARRLCAQQDHSVPQCPFDRLPINGFVALASGRLCDGRKGSSGTLASTASAAETAA